MRVEYAGDHHGLAKSQKFGKFGAYKDIFICKDTTNLELTRILL